MNQGVYFFLLQLVVAHEFGYCLLTDVESHLLFALLGLAAQPNVCATHSAIAQHTLLITMWVVTSPGALTAVELVDLHLDGHGCADQEQADYDFGCHLSVLVNVYNIWAGVV